MIDQQFKPSGLVTGVEAVKGGKAKEIDLQPGEKWTQKHYVEMNHRYQRQLSSATSRKESFRLVPSNQRLFGSRPRID